MDIAWAEAAACWFSGFRAVVHFGSEQSRDREGAVFSATRAKEPLADARGSVQNEPLPDFGILASVVSH